MAAVAGLVAVVGAAVCGPAVVVRLAADHGVSVARAGWCQTGLCLHELEAVGLHGLTVAHVAVDWDRTVRLVGVEVSARGSGQGDGVGDGVGSGTDGAALFDWVRRVTVEDLRVRDMPLPSLSGEVYPERHLRGEQFTLEGSVAEASVETPFGRVHLKVEPAGASAASGAGGLAALRIEADTAVLRAPESLLGEELALYDVHAVGEYRDGIWSGTVGSADLDLPAVVDVSATTATVTLDAVPLASLFATLAAAVPEGARGHILGTASGVVALTMHADGGVTTNVTDPVIRGFRVSGLVGDALRDSFTYATLDGDGSPSSRTTGPSVPGWTPLDRIGPMLPAAVIAAEDATFSSHPGYDLQSMVDAAGENAELGKVRRGGSTLTQQLAKNLYLDGTRTYIRKLRELLYAVDLEGALGKRGILETYLNVVEFGPGLYGCAAAADRYFLKSPSGLLPEEAAWLASILPSPRSAFRQQYERDRPNMARVQGILDNMVTLPLQDREAAKRRTLHFVQ